MLDILGRKLKEGDLVVVKGNGGYETRAKAMEVGIVRKNSVRTLTATRNPRDKFLIQYPSARELEIRDQILKQEEEEKEKAKKRAAERAENKKKNPAIKRGTVYKNYNNDCFLYYGYGTCEVYSKGVLTASKTGHMYIHIYPWYSKHVTLSEELLEAVGANTVKNNLVSFYEFMEKYITKGPKTVKEEVETIPLEHTKLTLKYPATSFDEVYVLELHEPKAKTKK